LRLVDNGSDRGHEDIPVPFFVCVLRLYARAKAKGAQLQRSR
jgi:hypothetical protein